MLNAIKYETSERGDDVNWVKTELLKSGLELLSFEGYTVKGNKVSALFDRGLFDSDINAFTENEVSDYLKADAQFRLKAKLVFASTLKAPFFFFAYCYKNENCVVFELSQDGAKTISKFNTYADFGKWTMQFRDLVMSSAYQESNLPEIDKSLRKSGTPWPGNLDYSLLKEDNPVALIEFQRTTKASVKDHCNNTWFLPTSFRKGDVNRWLAIDIIKQQSRLPLYIIVWSANEKEIKLKLVDKIVYPHDSNPKKGLYYSRKEMMKIEKLVEIFKGI